MSKSTTELLKDALELPEEQRVTLVIELLDSLNPVESGQGRTDAEWLAEVERRARAGQAGMGGMSWEQARQQGLDRLPKR